MDFITQHLYVDFTFQGNVKLNANQASILVIVGGILYPTISEVFLYGSIILSRDPEGFMQDPLVLLHIALSGVCIGSFFSISKKNIQNLPRSIQVFLIFLEFIAFVFISYPVFLYEGVLENVLKRNSFLYFLTTTIILGKFLWTKSLRRLPSQELLKQ